MKALYFDVETTGLDWKENAIHQLSGIIEVNGIITTTFNHNVHPCNKKIDENALKVSGKTVEQIMGYPASNDVYRDLIAMLGAHVDKYNRADKFFLIGYNNVGFDNNFLRAFFEANGDKYFGSWFWAGGIDVMVLSLEYLKEVRHKMPDFKLKTVAAQLGFNIDESRLHDAMYDIELTMAIYKKITNR